MNWVKELQSRIEKPIMLFDLETTGADPEKDEIVQYYSMMIPKVGESKVIQFLCKPSIPIEEGAEEVHGITNEMVESKPSFCHYANKIYETMSGIEFDLAGYNIASFDVPILDRQMSKCGFDSCFDKCYIFDVFNLFKEHLPRNLASAVYFYLDEALENAHDASVDVQATGRVMAAQLNKEHGVPFYELAGRTSTPPDKRVGFTNHIIINDDGEAVFNFGKHKGKPVKSERGYCEWIINKADFPSSVKKFLKDALSR